MLPVTNQSSMEMWSSYPASQSLSCTSFPGFHAGNLISSELRHMGRVKAEVFERPRKLSLSGIHGRNKSLQMVDKSVSSGFLRGSSVLSPMALGSNVSEDTDDIFDDLFKKYGKVVYTRSDKKSPIAEVDDDAESLSWLYWVTSHNNFIEMPLFCCASRSTNSLTVAVKVAKVASDVKAADIRVLFVKPLVYWTRFFIITTAFSRPQIDAIGSKIKDLAEKEYGKVASGDSKPNSWTLLDFGDVVVHIFLPEQRAFYNLEEFYANATLLELPFEN